MSDTLEVAEIESANGISIEDMCAKLETFENSIPLSSGYFSPEVGEVNLCYFLKHDRINPAKDNEENVDTPDGKVPAIRLLMQDGSVKVSAATGLVQMISESALPSPTPLRIILKEKEKRGARTFFVWDVARLQ